MTYPEPSSKRSKPQNKNWYEKTRFYILLFAAGVVLFAIIVGLILDWYIDPQNSAQRRDLIQALGLITAGAAGAVGIVFTWRGQQLTQQAQEDSRKNTQRTLLLTEQGQITDRFTKAIDQLGGGEGEQKRVEIQLGGVHALERIASESVKDYWPIMKLVAAYVRKYAPRDNEADFDSDTEVGLGHDDPVIQAILDTIASRSQEWGKGEEGGRVDLERTDLRNSAWRSYGNRGANLTGVWLFEADFRGANLARANLREASLYKADISYAILNEAKAFDTDFGEANFEGTMLKGADLQRARNLTQVQIDQAVGDEATLLPPGLKPPEHWEAQIEDQVEEK
jgi:hypothetical protein